MPTRTPLSAPLVQSPGSTGSSTHHSPVRPADRAAPAELFVPPTAGEPLSDKARGKRPIEVIPFPYPPRNSCVLRIGLREEDLMVNRKRFGDDSSLSPSDFPQDKMAKRVLDFSDAIHEACDHLTAAFGPLLSDGLPPVEESDLLTDDLLRVDLSTALVGDASAVPSTWPTAPFPLMDTTAQLHVHATSTTQSTAVVVTLLTDDPTETVAAKEVLPETKADSNGHLFDTDPSV
ncbi:unnamed protein product [Linum trigynum]|uniref:Uncharacterized protein n=1 Tax=Linum trigynum TaxID=586398 RepID=A0AAV2DDI9_9ROSI